MKSRNDKIIGFERIVNRNRIVRRIGLDTNIVIALVEDKETYSSYKPRIFKRINSVWINHIVYSEVIGVLINHGHSEEEARDKLKDFLRVNNIRVLAKKRLDWERFNSVFESLKRQREISKINADDKDLMIISIYKSEGIDCIVSINFFHFEQFCNYLGLAFEKPLDNVDKMLRNIFKWQSRKKRS